MEINLTNAISTFFPSPSLEMVFFEAIANSIDAGATRIEIDIFLDEYSKAETLEISIKDNGIGFVDKNFSKFSKLLEKEDANHKGLGRLVFLSYFDSIEIESYYNNLRRRFTFSPDFKGDSITVPDSTHKYSGTEIFFSKYSKQTIRTYDYLRPNTLIKSLSMQFFPLLHAMKMGGKKLEISVSLKVNTENMDKSFLNGTANFDLSDLPNLNGLCFKEPELSLTHDFTLYFAIDNSLSDSIFNLLVCAEGRTIPLSFIKPENVPQGFEIHFLLLSDFFSGKVNPSRQKLDLEDREMKILKRILIQRMNDLLNQDAPAIAEKNRRTKETLEEKFPHLNGFFDDCSIGLIDREKTLEIAQRKYFQIEKDILECSKLSEDQYFKSLDISSRVLAQYVLYRSKIISRCKSISVKESEEEIHNLFVPRRRIFSNNTQVEELFIHNAWLLDDKFMAYSKILSEKEMTTLIREITLENECERDDSRPDISIIFSREPIQPSKVDVVIIELKKKGVSLAKNEEVISQLKQRARKLANYYERSIQRIWYFGIVDIDKELRRALREEKFIELYSSGEVFYKEHEVIPDFDETVRVPTGLNVLSYGTLFNDAEARNSTFLNILKSCIKNASGQ